MKLAALAIAVIAALGAVALVQALGPRQLTTRTLIKSADETRAPAPLADDLELKFNVQAGTFVFEALVFASADNRLYGTFVATPGITPVWGISHEFGEGLPLYAAGEEAELKTAQLPGTGLVVIYGRVTATQAGTVTFQWRADAPGDATLKQGSLIDVRKVLP